VHDQGPVDRRLARQCTSSEPAIYEVQAYGVKLWLAPFGISEIFACPQTQISNISPAVPSHRGALRNVTDAGRDAVDADSAARRTALKRTAKSCGPDAPTLVSSWRVNRKRRWQPSMVTGESTK
jgi:hypothetical protein